MLRDDLLELRRSFHRCAYQHKTVKKMEQHMVDTLILLQGSDMRIAGRSLWAWGWIRTFRMGPGL